MSLDTHASVKLLIANGFAEKQAEAIVSIIKERDGGLVTKDDLKMALAELKVDILRWVMPFFLTIIVLIIGLWFK